MLGFRKIGIITYQAAHLKTEQVLNKLLAKRIQATKANLAINQAMLTDSIINQTSQANLAAQVGLATNAIQSNILTTNNIQSNFLTNTSQAQFLSKSKESFDDSNISQSPKDSAFNLNSHNTRDFANSNLQKDSAKDSAKNIESKNAQNSDFSTPVRGGGDLCLYALPFVMREERVVLFSHRPKQNEAISAKEIAQKWNLKYKECASDKEIPNDCDIYLILGCGILSRECLSGKRILNAHPGIIPNSRGLDSFKWAILKDRMLGVTLHYINEEVDSGEIVAIIPTPVYESDTLITLARRHYENEIDILANFEYYLQNPLNPYGAIPKTSSTKRMKPLEEKEMMSHFEIYKQKMAAQ